MYLLQVTLGSAATPILASAVLPSSVQAFSILVIQNNAAHVVRVGDSSVSSTKGIALAVGSTTPQPPFILTPSLQFTGDLREVYLFGTAADVVDILVCP